LCRHRKTDSTGTAAEGDYSQNAKAKTPAIQIIRSGNVGYGR
jgi:hypothetical protein